MAPINCDHINLLVLVAGLSGAGKSVAIDTLSDLGFYTVENLPVPLLPSFIEFTRQSPARFARTALSLDIDSREKQDLLKQFLKDWAIAKGPCKLELVFLDCKAEVIVKRYGQTRRPHPGFNPATDSTLEDAIEREKQRLFEIREISSMVIDSSELNVHDLRREIRSLAEMTSHTAAGNISVNFLSFGFRHGVPIDCDLIVDARFLPNPFFIDGLREKTGKDQEVIEYVMKRDEAQQFITRYTSLLEFLLPQYIHAGKLYLNIGVGCTGGRHRSVAISEELAVRLRNNLASEKCLISVKHRDIGKGE